jgi:hypothetical protein
MKGLILYCIFVIIGSVVDTAIGLFVEYEWSTVVWSTTVFLALFFFTFWWAWVLTVFIVDRALSRSAAR